ncbi:histidine kinase [Amycolatopsis thailandensis]|uniref:histidine kinase n=1 Tax=Amycolatopsis thailandensis TaxID=589330 RepID=A0A229S6L5_9PSEU|nr:SpoIIE family protein phosphatase [Amycolatopsis thailandensis]OXM54577.1 histidine kinase [Amycolatopsis thailandensis]
MSSEDAGGGGADVFAADGEVGRDLAAVDWTATPLGRPDGWPLSLRTAVGIVLSSRFSMWMAWGPELTFFCNSAYRRNTLGRKYPWALGRPANQVWSEIWDDIGPRIDTVLSSGKATWDEGLLLFLERSGYPEESYHTFSYSPLHDDAGQVVGMLCVVSEDTDRIIGERRMATLRDLGSDPTVITTEAQVLAFAVHQLGRNTRDLPFTSTYLFEDDGSARLAASTGSTVDAALPLPELPVEQLADGATMLIELDEDRTAELPAGVWPEPPTQALVIPLRQQQGGVPHGFLVAGLNRYRDLDEGYRGFIELVAAHIAAGIASARSYQAQQRRAEELAELDRAKTAFFSNISHEFRTPLTLIMGPVQELLSRKPGLDDAARADLEVVHRNGSRLSKLVNTLLDFSRLEAGRMQARFEPVDLAAVTAELASVFQAAVERAGLRFVVDCPPLGEPVHLDLGLWEKVVFNLLSNAVKFTFEGSITIAVAKDAAAATVVVADTGVGVPDHEIPRLFERFHRIENTRARSHEGSGIGLALVRELVELHGGTIAAASTEGVGTTFTVRLPFGSGDLPVGTQATSAATAEPYVLEAMRWSSGPPATEGAEDTEAAAATVGRPSIPARVVIADDNADMREYLTRLLAASGYVVEAVTDGDAAIDAIRSEAPDLVISDVMMPGLDGLGLVERLRSEPRTATVPVLLLSARAGQEASIEGLQAGADDYLVKPFASAELLARVRANVELARLRTRSARWRAALIDSLQEAFFVCDEQGAVVEINSAFTAILGYGPKGLPYRPIHPWWPDANTDPDAYRLVADAFDTVLMDQRGGYTIPVVHRNGHRVWVTASFNQVEEPDTGRRVTVGTFRDVTAEHYAVQRQSALAGLNQQLAQADSVEEAVLAAMDELRRVWKARRVLAVLFSAQAGKTDPVVIGEPVRWEDLTAQCRSAVAALRDSDPLGFAAGELGTAGVSLQHPDGDLVLWLELGESRPITGEDETLLTVLAGRLGQGLARVRQIDQQRETALALQHAILGPHDLPDGFVARYQPANSPLQVGGDWYDVVELEDGRVALVVGDCVGHGLAAATVMGQLRSACRALLLENPSPAAALTGLDRFAARLPGAVCTTAFCAVLSRDTGEMSYAAAGHPPPVLIHADRSTRLLEDGRSIPLGVRPGRPRSEARTVIPARATLVLYTDGLVERRRFPLSDGIERVAALVADNGDSTLEGLAGLLMSESAPEEGYEDDVALLTYRGPGPLDLSFPAEVGELAFVRKALRDWLQRCELDADMLQNILVASGEATANAIEHGHRDAPGGLVRLQATVLTDGVSLIISDNGSWKPPRPEPDSDRGRGLVLMRAFMDEVIIEHGKAGTTVYLKARIVR